MVLCIRGFASYYHGKYAQLAPSVRTNQRRLSKGTYTVTHEEHLARSLELNPSTEFQRAGTCQTTSISRTAIDGPFGTGMGKALERYSPQGHMKSLTILGLGHSLRHFRVSGRMVRRLRTSRQLLNDPKPE